MSGSRVGEGAVLVDVCSMQGVEGMNISKVAAERWVPSIRAVNTSGQHVCSVKQPSPPLTVPV